MIVCLKIFLFTIFGSAGSSLMSWGYSLVTVPRLFTAVSSRVVEHGLSSCGTQAQLQYSWVQLPHGMWNFPGPGIEPMFPAQAGGFLTTGSPGSPKSQYGYQFIYSSFKLYLIL